MYLFLGDETNKTQSDGEFFVYGGLIVSEHQAIAIHHHVVETRDAYGLDTEHKVKFTSNARPEHLSLTEWRDLKAGILELLVDCEAAFLAYYIHHDIIKNQAIQIQNQWAVESVMYRFQLFLQEAGDYGFAVLDNIEEEQLRRYDLARINAKGLVFDDGQDPVPLDRIIGLARSHVEWSHLLSASDIALGAFGYSINNPEHIVATELMSHVSRLFWHEEVNGVRYMGDRGLISRPTVVNSNTIKERYDRLGQHLDRLLNL